MNHSRFALTQCARCAVQGAGARLGWGLFGRLCNQAMQSGGATALFVENFARLVNALATLRLMAERAVHLFGAAAAGPGCDPQILFPNGVADADDHCRYPLSLNEHIIVRVFRSSKAFAN
jgi:hypothetical protein